MDAGSTRGALCERADRDPEVHRSSNHRFVRNDGRGRALGSDTTNQVFLYWGYDSISGRPPRILRTTEEIEELIKRAEPKVEMIFLEIACESQSSEPEIVPEHIG